MNPDFTPQARRTLGTLYASVERMGPYRNVYMGLSPLFDDNGDGGGDGSGDDGGGDDGGGDGGGDEEPELDEAGQPIQAHAFTDENARVRLPGSKKSITIKELNASLAARGRYEGGLKTLGTIAQLIAEKQKPQNQQNQQNQQRQQNQQPKRRASDKQNDPLATLRAAQVPTGEQIAAALESLSGTHIEPTNQTVAKLVDIVRGIDSRVNTFTGDREESQFRNMLNTVTAGLKLPVIDGKPIDGQDALNEVMRSFFFSYDPKDQKKLTAETFAAEFGPHFKKVRTFFRNLEKAEGVAAQQRKRGMLFQKRGPSSSANGQPRKFLTNKQVADALFDGTEANG